MLQRLISSEDGQDLVEYTLLLALAVVLSAALLYYPQDATRNIVSNVTDLVSRVGG